MNLQRMMGIACAFCMAIPLFAQQYRATLPYRMVGEKMVVEMNINGRLRPLIFDTGGHTALTAEACKALQIEPKDSMKVTDVNNKNNYYKKLHIWSLKTPDDKFNFKNVPALVFDEVQGWDCFGVDGIIGSDLFVNNIVSIDSKAKTITVTSAEVPSAVSLRRMLNFSQAGRMPVVSIQIAPLSNINVLFDTGCPGLLSMIDSDYEKIKDEADVAVSSEGYGEGSIGIAGQAGQASSHRVQIPLFSVGATKFRNITTATSNHPYTLLGVKLLEYGKVTIDYPRCRFYFEPYSLENMVANKSHNFDLTVKDGRLVVATVWSSANGEVSVGDEVIKINGKPVGKYDFCESILSGIPELKGKKQVKLTLRTASGEKVVLYKTE